MSGTAPWTPHSYPVQSPHTHQASPNGVLDKEEKSPPPSPPPQLPQEIRAVRDANAHLSKGRNLIICLDGTGDKFDNDNSNIVHLVSCLKKDDPSQVTYYQSGIGTYDGGGMQNGMNAGLDMAIGSGLGVHIRDAYRFLMQTYHEGDKILLFGFSRGAYTARCLAGMLHKVGLLPAHNPAQIPFAYEFYKNETAEGWKMSAEFKKTFCIHVTVHFIGVFDSVASVGFVPRKLPLSSTPANQAHYFRHAMALDEHRSKFKACFFKPADIAMSKENEEEMSATSAGMSAPSTGFGGRLKSKVDRLGPAQRKSEREKNEMDLEKTAQYRKTDVLEVWFTGCHADVGGGAVANEERHKLAQIPLRWMLRQCFDCNTGIIFHTAALAEMGLDVHTIWPVYTPLTKPAVGPSPAMMEKYHSGQLGPIRRRSTLLNMEPPKHKHTEGRDARLVHSELTSEEDKRLPPAEWTPEQVEDYFDAIAPINDQLVQAKGWWVLEFWPIKVKVQNKTSEEWEKKVRFNLGRYRPVMDTAPNVHWTVRQRELDKGYKMRTRVDRNAVWKVVA